ncbi:hypothetical protein HMPREF1547_01833 [Blautia sp. KLE 1732]|nr:hypothetical protein HMPREF1547_01833 [Blautia sp. KLE 1732]
MTVRYQTVILKSQAFQGSMRRILFCGVLISGTFITEKSGMRR